MKNISDLLDENNREFCRRLFFSIQKIRLKAPGTVDAADIYAPMLFE
jgi:hypothetical protein